MDQTVPTLPRERIVTLDIMRGFALLGILVVNMASFSGMNFDQPTTPWDAAAVFVVGVFFSGKFNSLFSLLFAIGFTIQLARLEQRAGEGALLIYVRRLLVLFALGLAHYVLVWDGDVLHMYALLGFALLPLRKLSDRVLLVLIAALLFVPGARSLVLLLFAGSDWTAGRVAAQQQYIAEAAATLSSGNYLDAVGQNLQSLQRMYTTAPGLDGLVLVGYTLFLVTMLIGLLAGRHAWIQRAPAHLAVVSRVQWWGLGIGIVAGIVLAVAGRFTEPFVPSLAFIVQRTAYSVSRVALMIFYVATIVRLANNVRWREWLMPLAAVGRMPLTNYLLQSVLCTAIFYGWGLGFWGRAGALIQLALAFAIFFGLQVPFSVLWFRRFAYGPLEYLWRLASYGRRPVPVPEETAAVPRPAP
jgi:uncharacterized protein